METVSGLFLRAIRLPHTRTTTAVHRNYVTGARTLLPVVDGTVTVSASSPIRRTLSLTLPRQQALWDALETPGGEVTVTQRIQYVDHAAETVALGVFIIDQDQMGYAPGDNLTLTGSDRYLKVSRHQFSPATGYASVPGNTVWQEIKRLVENCWAFSPLTPFPGWASVDTSANAKVGSLLWSDGDRAGAIAKMCTDNGVQVFFNAQGLGVIRPVPSLSSTSTPVWTVTDGQSGVMVTASLTEDRSTVFNAITVSTSATDVYFAPVEVRNTTAGDPMNVYGPLGYQALQGGYSSATVRNSTQARAVGLTLLSRGLGVGKQLSISTPGNPALDAEDIILVLVPKLDPNAARASQLQMIDQVVHPLSQSASQDISCRSTRPTADGS